MIDVAGKLQSNSERIAKAAIHAIISEIGRASCRERVLASV